MKLIIDIPEEYKEQFVKNKCDDLFNSLATNEFGYVLRKSFETATLETQSCEDCTVIKKLSKKYYVEDAYGYTDETIVNKVNEIIDVVNKLSSITLKTEQKWIPCTERLPDKLQDVLVTFYDAEGEYDVAYMRKTFNATYIANGAENEWVSSMGETTYADYEIAAWMPLMPYKAESEDKPKGRWIDIGNEGLVFKCSICGTKKTIESHFCPNCGARMTESEDKDADSN